jgi:co-chaperonin GroES (HSP10)
MGSKFFPVGDRVLVKDIDQEHSIDGVLMPDSAKQPAKIGIVVAVGDSKVYAEGDCVMHGAWAGKELLLDGEPFLVLREGEIDGKIIDGPQGA